MTKMILKILDKFGRIVKGFDNDTDVALYQQLYDMESLQRKKFYNIGAGAFSHPYWTNVDDGSDYFESTNGKGMTRIHHDLFSKKPLPVNDNDAELIYTSHTLEHIDNDSVRFFLHDCYRILKVSGVLRIVVPDIDLSYRAWRNNDRKYFFWIEWEQMNNNYEKHCLNIPLRDASITQIFLEDFAAAASEITSAGAAERISDEQMHAIFKSLPFEQALDYCTSKCTTELQKKFPFRHMNWFNEAKLRNYLEEAGFKTVLRSGFLQSTVPVMRNGKFFDSTMPHISLFMEAIK